MKWKDEKSTMLKKAQCYLSIFPCPVKKHTGYTYLDQLNNYQIQILEKEKCKSTPAY